MLTAIAFINGLLTASVLQDITAGKAEWTDGFRLGLFCIVAFSVWVIEICVLIEYEKLKKEKTKQPKP